MVRPDYASLPPTAAAGPGTPSNRSLRAAETVLSVLFIAVAMIGSFLSGKASTPAPYSRLEVLDLVRSDVCDEGSFVGGCSQCSECSEGKFAAGGCSYFKDTVCVSCAPIRNCPQENVTCDGHDDHVCSRCEPGYWGPDCRPCTVCPMGSFERQSCSHTQDAVCAPCSPCEHGQHLTRACTYAEDTECSACAACGDGEFVAAPCETHGVSSVYDEGKDTVCHACTQCAEGKFTASVCTPFADAFCEPCSSCPLDGTEFIASHCAAGSAYALGRDLECAQCAERRSEQFTVFQCRGDDTSDSLHADCSECRRGEYLLSACTPTSDAQCPDCTDVPHCRVKPLGASGRRAQDLTCTGPHDSVCHDCEDGFFSGPKSKGGVDGMNPESACCYQKSFAACGSATTRERDPRREGFSGASNAEFLHFCLELCDDLPDCMAVELADDGADGAESGDTDFLGTRQSCSFKSAYTGQSTDWSKDCYSNICRQLGRDEVRAGKVLTEEELYGFGVGAR